MPDITAHIVQAPEGTFSEAHYGEAIFRFGPCRDVAHAQSVVQAFAILAGEFLTPIRPVPIRWEEQ